MSNYSSLHNFEEALRRFDAAHAAEIYEKNGWDWCDGKGPNGCPTEDQIIAKLRTLYSHCVGNSNASRPLHFVASGRLMVIVSSSDDVICSLAPHYTVEWNYEVEQ